MPRVVDEYEPKSFWLARNKATTTWKLNLLSLEKSAVAVNGKYA